MKWSGQSSIPESVLTKGIKTMKSVRGGFSLKHIIRIIFAATAGLFILGCQTPQMELESLFTVRGMEGTIIITDLDGSHVYTAFPERAKLPLLPASTFKIPNTLIALEEGVIASPDEVFKWDGQVRFVDAWNQDHSLRTAFPVSCVWFYQELAKRIGNETYLRHLKAMDYGNKLTGPELTRFWLDGDLRITAEEQIAFLKRLYRGEFQFEPQHYALLKEVMEIEKTDGHAIYAKTGWAVRDDGEHGWYVGYVETAGDTWFFATNIEIKENAEWKYSKEITGEALRLTGIVQGQ